MSSLIELAKMQASIETALIESGGELTPEIELMIAKLDLSLPEKVDSYDSLMQRMENLGEYYKARADEFTKLRRACENFVQRLKDNITFAAETMKVEEITGVDSRFKMMTTQSVEVVELDKIPGAFIVTETIHKVDSRGILRELKEGASIPGVQLKQSKYPRRFANNRGKK